MGQLADAIEKWNGDVYLTDAEPPELAFYRPECGDREFRTEPDA
jgi:hypothetical protein